MSKFAIAIALTAAAFAAVPAAAVSVVGATRVVVTSAIPTWIQIAELQALQFGTGTNVALASNGGVATASSVYQNGSATPDKANDGIFPSAYPDIFHSGTSNTGEFLQIAFAGARTLSSLTIYGRTDCCTERDLFNVEIFNGSGASLFSGQLDARGAPGTITFDAPPAVPEPATWTLLIGGFGLTGAAMRRRKALSAA